MLEDLEREQIDLFVAMVEAQRSLPRLKRDFFAVHMSGVDASSLLLHPGFKGGLSVYEGDLVALKSEGLLYVAKHDLRGKPWYDIAREGYAAYDKYMPTRGEPIERVESAVRRLITSVAFQEHHPKAYAKWAQAEEMLYGDDTKGNLSQIGLLCREAAIQFAADLVAEFKPPDAGDDVQKFSWRVWAAIRMRLPQIGATRANALEALSRFWEANTPAIQKQTHSGEGVEELTVEDARAVVFHTGFLMHEIRRALDLP